MEGYKGILLLYFLTEYINTCQSVSADVMVAAALVEERNNLDHLSQEELAKKHFISQPNISRFIRKLGYSDFNEFKRDLKLSQAVIRKGSKPVRESFDFAVNDIHEKLTAITDSIYDLDESSVIRTVRMLREAKNIYFIGSELSMAILRLLQLRLIAMDKKAITIFHNSVQKTTVRTAEPDSLLVVVSMGQRWFKSTDAGKPFEKNKSIRMLWTACADHEDQDLFDHTVLIGDSEDPNLGYHSLMQFVLLLSRLL